MADKAEIAPNNTNPALLFVPMEITFMDMEDKH
jgi:hypothetical protein